MKPLILLTNDDGVAAKGLQTLLEVALEFGEVVVMAPETNASGLSHSITSSRPLRVHEVRQAPGLSVYSCDGTPVDCVKLASEHFCPRTPRLVLSGINHGSNSSINVLYSGTMGAVIEANALGFDAIGFSLLNHNPEADFSACIPIARRIIGSTLENGLPQGVSLNVNIPRLPSDEIKGIRICHAAEARWSDSFEKRIDPQGRPYWWLTGKFDCENPPESSDVWALSNGYVSVVPLVPDFTCHPAIDELKKQYPD
jgi:5'-nucleotidase